MCPPRWVSLPEFLHYRSSTHFMSSLRSLSFVLFHSSHPSIHFPHILPTWPINFVVSTNAWSLLVINVLRYINTHILSGHFIEHPQKQFISDRIPSTCLIRLRKYWPCERSLRLNWLNHFCVAVPATKTDDCVYSTAVFKCVQKSSPCCAYILSLCNII